MVPLLLVAACVAEPRLRFVGTTATVSPQLAADGRVISMYRQQAVFDGAITNTFTVHTPDGGFLGTQAFGGALAADAPAQADDGTQALSTGATFEQWDAAGGPWATWQVAGPAVAPAIDHDGTWLVPVSAGLLALGRDGAERWTAALLGTPVTQPAVGRDGGAAILYPTPDGQAAVAEVVDGAVVWEAPLPGAPLGPLARAGDLVLSFTGRTEEDGTVTWLAHGVDAGGARWSVDLGDQPTGSAMYADGDAIVSLLGGGLVRLDHADGGEEAAATVLPAPGAPTLDHRGFVWVACQAGLCVLDGDLRERSTVDHPNTTFYAAAPAIDDGTLAAVLDQAITVFDAPGLDLAPDGWPRDGGSARGDGREAHE